jgi:hypothetical protein
VDPADLRAEPIEDELDLEYLVYGLFERPDRPDGAFLSKRWVRMDNLLEHGGYGNLKAKIDEYEASKAKRVKAAVEAKFDCVAAERGDGGREGCAGVPGHTGKDSDSEDSEDSDSENSDSEDSNSEEAGTGITLAEICGRGSKRALDVAA